MFHRRSFLIKVTGSAKGATNNPFGATPVPCVPCLAQRRCNTATITIEPSWPILGCPNLTLCPLCVGVWQVGTCVCVCVCVDGSMRVGAWVGVCVCVCDERFTTLVADSLLKFCSPLAYGCVHVCEETCSAKQGRDGGGAGEGGSGSSTTRNFGSCRCMPGGAWSLDMVHTQVLHGADQNRPGGGGEG